MSSVFANNILFNTADACCKVQLFSLMLVLGFDFLYYIDIFSKKIWDETINILTKFDVALHNLFLP